MLLKRLFLIFYSKDGLFGAHMMVSIENDGPVTIELNSPQTQQVCFILNFFFYVFWNKSKLSPNVSYNTQSKVVFVI